MNVVDANYHIAVARSASSAQWSNNTITWSELVSKLRTPTITRETYKEYMCLPKPEQAKIKDVGGFVAGYLVGGSRNKRSVHCRSMLSLDVDFAPLDFADHFQATFFGVKAVIHGTHKHSDSNPRLRVVIPLSRIVTPDEYQAVSRWVAAHIGGGIQWFDKTTFQPERMMFWPSVSSDSSYYFKEIQGVDLSPDAVLAQYVDWHDVSAWPKHPDEVISIGGAKDMQNPLDKKGAVGDFCRLYSISSAIENYLPDIYEASEGGRYTYKNGSSANGVVVYDDLYLYSHHGTDPAGGQLLNAFDLVRLHKFGHEDEDNKLKGANAKSYKAMLSLMADDPKLKIAKYEKVLNVFSEVEAEPQNMPGKANSSNDANTNTSKDWLSQLEMNKRLTPEPTAENIRLILQNDSNLKGVFGNNAFDGRRYIMKTPPWRKTTKPETMRDVDMDGLNCYMEKIYKIWAPNKIQMAFSVSMETLKFNPVKDFIEREKWDGVKRIEGLFQQVMGADDTLLTREVAKKFFTAAVKRIYEPGCKYDNVLVLHGPEDFGKSTFFATIAGNWFSDSFSFSMVSDVKKCVEQISGKWIIEVPEMRGLKNADDNAAKAFISAQVDTTRKAYGREPEDYPRQCILVGTTNNDDFLRISSGNRRYWVIGMNKDKITMPSWSDELKAIVGQLWAEAFELYKSGESVVLSQECKAMAAANRLDYTETDERTGIVRDFLDKPVPDNYDSMTKQERMTYFQLPNAGTGRKREYISRAQIYAECLGKDPTDMSRTMAYELSKIMKEIEGWEFAGRHRIDGYGQQRVYENKENIEYNRQLDAGTKD